jgi:hypothetical protein
MIIKSVGQFLYVIHTAYLSPRQNRDSILK